MSQIALPPEGIYLVTFVAKTLDMERKIITTSDGSKSVYLPDLDETYHSRHGAIQEAYHVFIRSGLDLFEGGQELRILEMGFGTGLNCFITWLEALQRNLAVFYHGLEAYPVDLDLVRQLDYPGGMGQEKHRSAFESLHSSAWDQPVAITENFSLFKARQKFSDFRMKDRFDLVYFDAFGPRVQPDLWTEAMFRQMYDALRENGVLVTYSAKGSVRRALQAVGFKVERLPGPPGKREMLRAIKSA